MEEEQPPLTVQIKMMQLPNGSLQFEIRGEGFPEVDVVMSKVME